MCQGLHMFSRKSKNKNPVNITPQKPVEASKTESKNSKNNAQLDIARENMAIAQGTSVQRWF